MYLRPIGLCSAASIYFVQFYAPVVIIWLVYEWLLPYAAIHWFVLLKEAWEMPSKPGGSDWLSVKHLNKYEPSFR